MNKIGLTTQLPMNIVYITDGSQRRITIGKSTIKFKKASPKLLSAKNEMSILIIQALREIGKDNVDKKVIKRIKEIINKLDKKTTQADMKLAPAWIRELINKIIKEETNEMV